MYFHFWAIWRFNSTLNQIQHVKIGRWIQRTPIIIDCWIDSFLKVNVKVKVSDMNQSNPIKKSNNYLFKIIKIDLNKYLIVLLIESVEEFILNQILDFNDVKPTRVKFSVVEFSWCFSNRKFWVRSRDHQWKCSWRGFVFWEFFCFLSLPRNVELFWVRDPCDAELSSVRSSTAVTLMSWGWIWGLGSIS